MEKTVKYELTKEEKDLLMKCANEVAKNCNCDYCQEGCPFNLEQEGCVLEKLEEIVNSCD